MKQLGKIRETISIYPQPDDKPPKLSYSISRLNKMQKRLYDTLDLARFRQN